MLPHQERVVTEKKELDEKRAKLGAFIEGGIFQTLSSEERNRLEQQAIAMTRYSTILGVAAITAQNADGTYFFSDEELEELVNTPYQVEEKKS